MTFSSPVFSFGPLLQVRQGGFDRQTIDVNMRMRVDEVRTQMRVYVLYVKRWLTAKGEDVVVDVATS